MILNTKAAPPPSSEWVQIWQLGLKFFHHGEQGNHWSRERVIPSTGFNTSTSFNTDLYLQSGDHITKINFVALSNYPYGVYLHYITEENKDILGTIYYYQDPNSGFPYSYHIEANYTDTIDYGFMFFKEAPEGDFKTWLETYCQQIL